MVAIAPIGPFTPVAQLDVLQAARARRAPVTAETAASALRLPVDAVELTGRTQAATAADFLPRVTLALNLSAAAALGDGPGAPGALLEFALQAPPMEPRIAAATTGAQTGAIETLPDLAAAAGPEAEPSPAGEAPQGLPGPVPAYPPENSGEVAAQQAAGAAALAGEIRTAVAPLEDVYARGDAGDLLSADFIQDIEELVAAVEIREDRIADRVRLTGEFREVMALLNNPPPAPAFTPGLVNPERAVRAYHSAAA